MTAQRTGIVVLSRGEDVIARNPSLDDVVALMRKVYADQGLGGAPEVVIKYFKDVEERNYSAWLLLLPAFKESATTKWVVDFSIAKSKDGSLLARRVPTDDEFEVRTTVGVLTAYRPVCLLDDGPIIHDAIEWFLRFHTQNPKLNWINYWDAVRHF